MTSTKNCSDKSDKIEELAELLQKTDTVLIGAGAGLSTSAGFTYTGERFQKYFSDFIEKYGFEDMYSGGFYPFESLEEHWAYWSRYILINRYMDCDNGTYQKLFELVKDKDTKEAFDSKKRLGYQIYKNALQKGLLLRPLGDVLYFNPPLNIDKQTLDKAISICHTSINEVLNS